MLGNVKWFPKAKAPRTETCDLLAREDEEVSETSGRRLRSMTYGRGRVFILSLY